MWHLTLYISGNKQNNLDRSDYNGFEDAIMKHEIEDIFQYTN